VTEVVVLLLVLRCAAPTAAAWSNTSPRAVHSHGQTTRGPHKPEAVRPCGCGKGHTGVCGYRPGGGDTM
jgi:hypothetical protein